MGGVGVGVDGVGWKAGGIVAGVVVARFSAHLGRGRPNGEEERSEGEGLHSGLETEGRLLVAYSSRRQQNVVNVDECNRRVCK